MMSRIAGAGGDLRCVGAKLFWGGRLCVETCCPRHGVALDGYTLSRQGSESFSDLHEGGVYLYRVHVFYFFF